MLHRVGADLAGRKTPAAAVLLVTVGALVCLPLGGVGLVGSVASLLALVTFAAVNAALVRCGSRSRTRNGRSACRCLWARATADGARAPGGPAGPDALRATDLWHRGGHAGCRVVVQAIRGSRLSCPANRHHETQRHAPTTRTTQPGSAGDCHIIDVVFISGG